MRIYTGSIIIITATLLTVVIFLGVKPAHGESYIPPVPDPMKTLPANNGEPAGCDCAFFAWSLNTF